MLTKILKIGDKVTYRNISGIKWRSRIAAIDSEGFLYFNNGAFWYPHKKESVTIGFEDDAIDENVNRIECDASRARRDNSRHWQNLPSYLKNQFEIFFNLSH